MSRSIEVKVNQDIALVEFNRPEAYNAFNHEVMSLLWDELTLLARDVSVRAVVMTGRGKAFCAGGDLKWVQGQGGLAGDVFHRLAQVDHGAITEIRRMPKPVIAAVNGIAAGGGFSLALACDFRVMDQSAVMRQGFTSNGLSIDGGGTFILPRLVGLARALEIAAFDAPIPSDQALEWGLATKVVDDGTCVEEAMAMARDLSQRSISSFAASKRLLTDSYGKCFEEVLEDERRLLAVCADSADGVEALAAFVEKRKPVYKK
ncbi:MAG: enoyl-CoA hydratase/isomerase family protein [Proteobacteria bacterium]|nr:enoyl-CoA hydratase/isomerase family protein [Pseudomonadota bacterium]MBU1740565.1 enoyl-CoA hydratase/isomerase family protein [Pseudomonadota bacterium]